MLRITTCVCVHHYLQSLCVLVCVSVSSAKPNNNGNGRENFARKVTRVAAVGVRKKSK